LLEAAAGSGTASPHSALA